MVQAADRMGLSRRFVRASELDAPGARSEHLLAICQAVGASEYVSPMGSSDYREEDGVFAAAGFAARFQAFSTASYPQGRGVFEPFIGFVDALMNVGWTGCANWFRRGRNPSG